MSVCTIQGQLQNGGAAIAGSMRVTLTSPLISTAVIPNILYTTDPITVAITSTGNFSITLPWTTASGIPYLFEFFNTANTPLYKFYAIIPELASVQLDDIAEVDWDFQQGDISAARVFERLRQLESVSGLLSNSVIQRISTTPPSSPFADMVWIQLPELYHWRRVGSQWESKAYYVNVNYWDQPPVDLSGSAFTPIPREIPVTTAPQVRILGGTLEVLQSGSSPGTTQSFNVTVQLIRMDGTIQVLLNFTNSATPADQKISVPIPAPTVDVIGLTGIRGLEIFVTRNGSGASFVQNTAFAATATLALRYLRI